MIKVTEQYLSRGAWKERNICLNKMMDDIKDGTYMKKATATREQFIIPEVIDNEWYGNYDEITMPVIRPAMNADGYTGLVCVSLNFNGNMEEAENAKARICIMPQVMCCFVGLSAMSLKVFVRFTNENGTLPTVSDDISKFHACAYQSAAALLMQVSGLKAEGELGDWRNGIHMSADTEAYYNENAIAIPLPQPHQLPSSLSMAEEMTAGMKATISFPDHSQTEMDVMRFNLICRKLRFQEEKDNGEYILTLANECRKAGIECEVAIRCTLRMVWQENKEMLIRTCFENAYAEKPMGQKLQMPRNVINQHLLREYMDRRYVFRRNTITGSVEYVERNRFVTSWRPLTPLTINTICMAAQDAGIEAWRVDVERYVNSDRITEWDPIRSWISSLPEWDGMDRVAVLAGTIKTTSEYWKHDFSIWLRSMVKQWMGRGGMYGSSMVLMLIGGQGTGKSTFCKRIMPPALMEYYNDRIDFSTKREAERALTRFGLICMDEFDQITPSQTAYLKHILQKSDVKWRKMYQDDIEQKQRYATFCATTNSYSPLSDPSGSRRYLCTEVLSAIDVSQQIDHEQLYAQILHEMKQGEQCFFSAEDELRIQSQNSCFQREIPLQTMLLSSFRKSEEGEELTSAEILEKMKKRFKNIRCDIPTITKLGKILSNNHFQRKRVNRGWVYTLEEICHEDSTLE